MSIVLLVTTYCVFGVRGKWVVLERENVKKALYCVVFCNLICGYLLQKKSSVFADDTICRLKIFLKNLVVFLCQLT